MRETSHTQQTGASSSIEAPPAANIRSVRIWLYIVAAMVALMVLLGGATRLTGSGLSITDWEPIIGIVPPLTSEAWQDAFGAYKQIPQYRQINRGMSLGEFKIIYWWEWSHRFLGRIIGLAFAIPLALFWWQKRLPPGMPLKLLGILALGGLQGLAGWYMVASGLVDRVDVSQYRLALHLGLAMLIFALVFRMARGLGLRTGPANAASDRLCISAHALVVLIFLQIILGAFVAGMKAGLVHNTWPLMDGQLIPSGLAVMTPWYTNLFENALTVQFNHRMVAYAICVWAVVHLFLAYRERAGERIRFGAGAVLAAVLLQVALGIHTLVAHVPLILALLHQGTAVVVLAVAVSHAQDFDLSSPSEGEFGAKVGDPANEVNS